MRYSRSLVAPSGFGQVFPCLICEFFGRVSSTISTSSGGKSLAPILADHQLQARPDVVDRCHLDVHEIEAKRGLPHGILRHIGLDLRSLLWPGDPDHAIRLDRRLQESELA